MEAFPKLEEFFTFSLVGASQAKNFSLSPPRGGLPKLRIFHFPPPVGGSPKLGEFFTFSPPWGLPKLGNFSLFPPVGAPQAREFFTFIKFFWPVGIDSRSPHILHFENKPNEPKKKNTQCQKLLFQKNVLEVGCQVHVLNIMYCTGAHVM